jgi:hypothetical protein
MRTKRYSSTQSWLRHCMDEYSVSRPVRLTPRVGPRTGMDVSEPKPSPVRSGNQTIPLTYSPWTRHYTNWANSVPLLSCSIWSITITLSVIAEPTHLQGQRQDVSSSAGIMGNCKVWCQFCGRDSNRQYDCTFRCESRMCCCKKCGI